MKHLGDLIQVAGDAAEDFAGLVLVEEAQGQAVELAGNLIAQLQVEAFGHIGHQVGLEVVENPGEEVLDRQLGKLLAHVGPGDGKGRAVVPGGLNALP